MPRRNIYIILIFIAISFFGYRMVSLRERVFCYFLHFVEKRSLDPTDRKTLLEGAFEGMMMTSDYYPYSGFIPPSEEKEHEEEIQGRFVGVGFTRMGRDEKSGEYWFTPIYHSPAGKAGLRFGDRLVAVDGEPVTSLSPREVSEKLRGEPETDVHLTIRPREEILATVESPEEGTEMTPLHSGSDDPFSEGNEDLSTSDENSVREVTITRGTIQSDIVQGDYLDQNGQWIFTLKEDPSIGYIRIDQFTNETDSEFQSALQSLEDQKIDSLILDLRDNPGGMIGEAINVCDHFLPNGAEIVSVWDRQEKQGSVAATDCPKSSMELVVLIDQDSASAAELVAAALADHGRATLIGHRSYGKGTIQEEIPLPYEMGLLRLTSANFKRPSGKSIHRKRNAKPEEEWGVAPDPEMDIPLSFMEIASSQLFRDLHSIPLSDSDRSKLKKIVTDRILQEKPFILKSDLTEEDLTEEGETSEGTTEEDLTNEGETSEETTEEDLTEEGETSEGTTEEDLTNEEETSEETTEEDLTNEGKTSEETGKETSDRPVRISGKSPYYDRQLEKAIEFFQKKKGDRPSPPNEIE